MKAYDSICVASVQNVMEIFGNKWAFLILKQLHFGSMRFNQLQKSLHINTKSLSDTFKHLEKNGIITRTVFPTVPITVKYSLTEKGRAFDSVLDAMKKWRKDWCTNPEEQVL